MPDYLHTTFDATSAEHVAGIDELAFWSAPFGLMLLEVVRLAPGMRVLDVGCGTGFPLFELAARLGNTATVVGVDLWENALERVRQKIRVRRLHNVDVRVMAAEELAFADGTFDLIVSNNGLNNVADAARALAQCFRVCREGGQLVFTFNLPATMQPFYDALEGVLRTRGMQAAIANMHAHIHAKRKSVEETTAMAVAAGFRVATVTRGEFTYRFADAEALLSHYTIREFFLPAWKALLPDSDAAGIFAAVAETLNQSVARDGELRLPVPHACFDCRKG